MPRGRSQKPACWGAWDTTLRAQNQGHHTTDRLEQREVCRKPALEQWWSTLKRAWDRVIVHQTNIIGTVSKASLGDTSEIDGVERIIMGFPERLDIILTELRLSWTAGSNEKNTCGSYNTPPGGKNNHSWRMIWVSTARLKQCGCFARASSFALKFNLTW